MLRSKFTKLLPFLKQQIRFFLNFEQLFSVMRHKSSTHFCLEFYILSTKGAYQSTNLLKFHVGSRKSEILHVIGFPLSKSSAKRLQKSYLSKLKVTLTCGFKYDMRNLVNFHPTAQTSKNVILMGSFCPNYTRFYLQKFRYSSFMAPNSDTKF